MRIEFFKTALLLEFRLFFVRIELPLQAVENALPSLLTVYKSLGSHL